MNVASGNCGLSVLVEGGSGVNKQKQKPNVNVLQGEDRGREKKNSNCGDSGRNTCSTVTTLPKVAHLPK